MAAYDPTIKIDFKPIINKGIYDSMAYGTTIKSPPPPSGDLCLTEELDQPLHHYNEFQLEELAHELHEQGWGPREQQIAKLTKQITMEVYSQRQRSIGSAAITGHSRSAAHVESTYAEQRSGNYTYTIRLRVLIPDRLPDEFVKPFVERMIRDQIEEG